jgi:hypothetical protein
MGNAAAPLWLPYMLNVTKHETLGAVNPVTGTYITQYYKTNWNKLQHLQSLQNLFQPLKYQHSKIYSTLFTKKMRPCTNYTYCKSKQETRFSNSWVTNQQQFEEVITKTKWS